MPQKITSEKPENTENKQKVDRRKSMPHLFKKGQSGNPKGKPKGSISLTAMIKRKLQVMSPDQKRNALEVLAENIIQDALDGSSEKMRELIWNYLEGKPRQGIDIDAQVESKQVRELILTTRKILELKPGDVIPNENRQLSQPDDLGISEEQV